MSDETHHGDRGPYRDVRKDDDETHRFQANVYRLRDQVYAQEVKLAEQTFALKALSHTVELLRATVVTSEQLTSAVAIIGLQIANLTAQVEPLKKTLSWVGGVVGTAMILAVLGLVFKK